MKASDRSFMRGFALALLSIWTMHNDGDMVRHVLKGNGFTFVDLLDIGLDADDPLDLEQSATITVETKPPAMMTA